MNPTNATEFFTCRITLRRIYTGPLGPYIDELADWLQQLGYSRNVIRNKIRVVSRLSYWLRHQKLDISDIDIKCLKRFLVYRKRIRYHIADDAAAVRDVEMLLRSHDLIDTPESLPVTEVESIVEGYRAYLAQDRGLSVSTVRCYLPFISRFLCEHFGKGPARLEALSRTNITTFVQRHAHGHSHSRAMLMVKALRSFLRYLYYHGSVPSDLAACVPAVARWSFSRLPSFLSATQVEQVLDHCNRNSTGGRRDYAILLMCARLGLRAAEVAGLVLDDIDWESGHLALRNKGGRWTQMPLQYEVGEALADYLVNGRPTCDDRHVFVRQRAPQVGLSSRAISSVASSALTRAGIDCPRKGAHVFRHSLATEMMRQGASLTEIAQLLRHQHPDTTRLYAKVDVLALRELALPWPGGER